MLLVAPTGPTTRLDDGDALSRTGIRPSPHGPAVTTADSRVRPHGRADHAGCIGDFAVIGILAGVARWGRGGGDRDGSGDRDGHPTLDALTRLHRRDEKTSRAETVARGPFAGAGPVVPCMRALRPAFRAGAGAA